MNFVTDRIAIGSWRSASNLAKLKEKGVGAVLNVARNLDINFMGDKTHGHFPIEYQKVGMNDSYDNDPCMLVAAVITLEQLLKRHEKVLVNCQAGASRSVTVVCLHLIKTEGISFKEAIDRVKERREQAGPGAGMRKLAQEVIDWELL